jgi:hypothetical protein
MPRAWHEAFRRADIKSLRESAPADAIDRAAAISGNASDANPVSRGNDDKRDNDDRRHDHLGNRDDSADNAALGYADSLAVNGRVGRSRACRQEEQRR